MSALVTFLTAVILATAGVAMPTPEGYEYQWDADIMDCPNVTRTLFSKEATDLVFYTKDGNPAPFVVIEFVDGVLKHYWYDPDRDGVADAEGDREELNKVFPENDVCIIADEVP